MRIAPISTNYLKRNYNVNFSGYYDSDKESEIATANYKIAAIVMSATVGAIMLATGASFHDKKKPSPEEMCEKIENIYNRGEIQKDTFTVKDMNGDKIPDLILCKNDGTNVVIDIANQQVVEKINDSTHVK